MQNIGFSDSSYVIKPPQPSSTVYRAPPFTGHPTYVLGSGGWTRSRIFLTPKKVYYK